MSDVRISDGSGRTAIAYVVTHYPKLAQTFIANEILAVEDAGQPVRIFAMNPPDAIERRYPDGPSAIARTTYLKPSLACAFITLGALSLRHPAGMASVWWRALSSGGGSLRRTARRLSHLAQAALVARAALRDDITRIHAHFGLAPATIAWLAALTMRACGRTKAAFSFTIHGFHDFVDAAESRLDLKAAGACTVFCISDFTRSQLCLATDPELWQKFQVRRCGVDTRSLAYRDPAPLGGEARLLAVGRLSSEKGYSVLLDAVRELRDQGQRVSLRIIGDGPERGRLEAQISKLGLGHAVVLAGELPPGEVRRELAESDIFVMASFSEGLPVSIMEAMAIGTPVVTTWVSGIPELARSGCTAVSVAPANPRSLAKGIGSLLADPLLRQGLARNARAFVEERHDLARNGALLAHHFGEPPP